MKKTNKVEVFHTFLNKKNESKSVSFMLDKKLYNDILTLPEKEKNYWLTYYYHEYCKEQNQYRKEFRHRERYLQIECDNAEEQAKSKTSEKKLSKLASNEDVEITTINKLMVEQILSLLDETERYIVVNVLMYNIPKTKVALDLGISDSAVNKKLRKITDKILSQYRKNE